MEIQKRRRRTGGVWPDEPGTASAYWTLTAEQALESAQTKTSGLDKEEAERRLRKVGENALAVARKLSKFALLWAQLKSPLVLLLLFAAGVSVASGEWADASIVLVIVAASAGLGYSREYAAHQVAHALSKRVHSRSMVIRGGEPAEVDSRLLVPGDVVLLRAGCAVPADGVLLEATDFHVSEAVLTGESFPVEKSPGPSPRHASLRDRQGCVMLGTHVRSGSARFVVMATGSSTGFGAIAKSLSLRPPETEFERGIRHFGAMLTSVMGVMVAFVFTVHVLSGRPPIETLLFAIALAVGLSPELLPAILGVNLARGAAMMGRHGVLVRHLQAIENLGSMDILCTDKTGTLTEGVVEVEGAWGPDGQARPSVLELARTNARLGTGLANPLDEALLMNGGTFAENAGNMPLKIAEVPFDFVRKRASVVVAVQGASGTLARFVVKGAIPQVLAACAEVRVGTVRPIDEGMRAGIEALVSTWAGGGIRAIAVATREIEKKERYGRDDEEGLILEGFVTFSDHPKPDAASAVAALKALGVQVKLVTGDSARVAQYVAGCVGLDRERMLTGAQMEELNAEAFWRAAETTDIFAEVDPNDKERIIVALRKTGHVVGFLGDGVNDAPAMHAADTSISVDKAVDVAREAADFVLLEHDLDVIREGIIAGRRTFANTLKYVLTTTSANLGNMLSMAVASVFLPFLPLTAGQILLNNFLSDIPAFGIASDAVDPELVSVPRRWDMKFLRRFMFEFGALSSLFDLLTFGLLLWTCGPNAESFRTGWFVESLLTELVIALAVRTRRPLTRSRPGRALLYSTVAVGTVALTLPYLPFAPTLGMKPLPVSAMLVVIGVTVAYLLSAEVMKRWFYRQRVR